MSSSVDAQLASLRAAKLPRLQRAILKHTSQNTLRDLLVALTSHAHVPQQTLILKIVEKHSTDTLTTPPAEDDDMEAQFTILCGPILHEHRVGILEDYSEEETSRLLKVAINFLSATSMQELILAELDDVGVSSAKMGGAAKDSRDESSLTVMREDNDTKRTLAEIEWDEDERQPQSAHTIRSTVRTTRQPKRRRADGTCEEVDRGSTGASSRPPAKSKILKLRLRQCSTSHSHSSPDRSSNTDDANEQGISDLQDTSDDEAISSDSDSDSSNSTPGSEDDMESDQIEEFSDTPSPPEERTPLSYSLRIQNYRARARY